MKKAKVIRWNWIEEDDEVEGFEFDVPGYSNKFVVHLRNKHSEIWDVTESKSGLRFPYREDKSQVPYKKTRDEAIASVKAILATMNQEKLDQAIKAKCDYQNSLYPNQISI